MHRCNKNEGKQFSAALDATVNETEALLSLRRKQMTEGWDGVDKGWQDLENRMAEVGITKPLVSDGRIAWLNVGGSLVSGLHSVFEGKKGPAPWILADVLFAGVWDERLPRDSEGLVVLDESPACVKHLIHTSLKSSGKGGDLEGALHDDTFAYDEKPNLSHVSRALQGPVIGMVVTGGSTVFEPNNVDRLTAIIRGWYPEQQQPNELQLLYRASRHGWTGLSFHDRCGSDNSSTITLFRVKSRGSEKRDVIVGGFSSISWTGRGYHESPGAFLFMLEDGGVTPSRTVKWSVKDHCTEMAVETSRDGGPAFGEASGFRGCGHDLSCNWDDDSTTLDAEESTYDTKGALGGLNKRPLVEIETFRVCSTAATAPRILTEPAHSTRTIVADTAHYPSSTAVSTKEHSDDIQAFGESIAGLLLEERMAIREAQIELVEAGDKVTASVKALATVYGPDVAAGKEDPVVELSVRGSRVTTLLSTLQACPESFLAAKFNEDRWPATDKEVDEHGRRIIDCSPSVFAKVLDVLRMRKRAGWARISSSHQECDDLVRVIVNDGDREAFEEFVEKHFPGDIQSFIMDCVEPNPESAYC